MKLSSVSEEICLPKIVTLAEIGVARSRAAITAMKNEDESFSSGVTSFYLLDAGNGAKRIVQILWIQSRAALVDPDSANLAVNVFFNSRILKKGKTGDFGLSVRKHILPGCEWIEMKIAGGEKI